MTWTFQLRALICGESAQDLIEYALLAGFIALGTVVMTTQLSGTLTNTSWQQNRRDAEQPSVVMS